MKHGGGCTVYCTIMATLTSPQSSRQRSTQLDLDMELLKAGSSCGLHNAACLVLFLGTLTKLVPSDFPDLLSRA